MFPDLTVGIFMDTVYMRSIKTFMIKTLLEVYRFAPSLINLTLFHGNMCVRIINCILKKEKRFSTVVYMLLCGSYIQEKIKYGMLCVTGVC